MVPERGPAYLGRPATRLFTRSSAIRFSSSGPRYRACCASPQQFGASRLEVACRRANHFGTPSYKAVKLILQKGLDQTWLSTEPVESGATTYTHGGRFCRDTQTLLIH